jgi:hypothetical protein
MARPLQDEADPMREYDDDDNIRLYAPVLQRVIILAAVVIAVPVMMWTITTFIRSYVARPQVPYFQHLTLSEAPQSLPPASPLTATPPPPQGVQGMQGVRPAQPGPAAALADTATVAGGGQTPSDTGSSAPSPANSAPPSSPPVPVMAGAAVDNNPAQAAAPTPPAPAMASPDAAGLPTVAKPAGLVARLANNASGKPSAAPAAAPAWPNPSAGGPPSLGAPQPSVAMAETASTEALPPPQPIKGRVPLPRGRPAAIALAATEDMTPPAAVADTAGTDTAATDALPPPQPIKGRVPLPRRRPAVLASLAATGSLAVPLPTGRAVPMPKTRPVEAPPDPHAPVSAPYGYQPGLDGGR